MRKLIGLLCLVIAVSCNEPLVDSLPRFMREQGRTIRGGEPGDTSARPPMPTPEPSTPEYVPSVYATALHFRDSVNWRLDSLGAAEVLFFKDGSLVRRQQVSSPPDPERHRIWNGQLWTDYTDGHETVLLCDGLERFRFPGEELLRGFLIVDGDVHTLGQRPGNSGFCYRINGELIFSQDKGSVLGSPSSQAWKGGALNLDGGDVYYSYRTDHIYYVMKGGQTFRIVTDDTFDALFDLRVYGGHLWRIQKKANTLSLVCDEEVRPLTILASEALSCQLVPSGDQAQVLGSDLLGGGWYSFWLAPFDNGTPLSKAVGRSLKSELCYRDPDLLFADVNTGGFLHQLYYNGTDLCISPGVYSGPSARNLFLSANHYAAALTHSGAGPHLLLYDGKETSLSFNGYFTSVQIE
jgi:hypothetical protein